MRPDINYNPQNKDLEIGGLSAAAIAEKFGTPCYVYSANAIQARLKTLQRALGAAGIGERTTICFACKANDRLGVLAEIAALGGGADIVSGGELKKTMSAGIPPEKIVYSGVGKSREELQSALDAGILQINVENGQELKLISEIAKSAKAHKPHGTGISLRYTPNISSDTHHKTATGHTENKFGLSEHAVTTLARTAKEAPHLRMQAISIHIGSQIVNLDNYDTAFQKLRALVDKLAEEGITLSHIDLGGGMGISYGRGTEIDIEAYTRLIARHFGDTDHKLIIEPGRYLVAEAGVLIGKVLYTKERASKAFAILDAGMDALMRPALYDSWHDIVPLHAPDKDAPLKTYDIAGPICETGDIFGNARTLPELRPGDRLAVLDTGAYGATMSNRYNARPSIPEILVKDGACRLIVQPPSIDDIIDAERKLVFESRVKT